MPKKVEKIVKALVRDGKSKESAYAIAYSTYNKTKKKTSKKKS